MRIEGQYLGPPFDSSAGVKGVKFLVGVEEKLSLIDDTNSVRFTNDNSYYHIEVLTPPHKAGLADVFVMLYNTGCCFSGCACTDTGSSTGFFLGGFTFLDGEYLYILFSLGG